LKGGIKMTIRDLTDQFEIQGSVTVKEWNEKKQRYNILIETDSAIFNSNTKVLVIDREIKYMYAVNNTLVIEVE
jgi:hypothetical protein